MFYRSVKEGVFDLLEAGRDHSRASRILDMAMSMLIIANIIAVVIETVPDIVAAYGEMLRWFDRFSVAVFTVEYLLRVWSSTAEPHLARMGAVGGRIAFMMRPFSLIDLIAIAPYYMSVLFSFDLRIVRIFRLLRFFKLMRYSSALGTLGRVVMRERHALLAALLIMFGLLIASATVMYHIEHLAQPNAFGSIPQAMWWALATLTTIGYGDVVPITAAGRVVGGVVMLFGLGMYALPIGLLATGFYEEIHRHEFVVTWGMVARVPLFKTLSAADVSAIMALLSSVRIKAGSVIMEPEEQATEMYFISMGEVEMHLDGECYRLKAGDYFGERAIMCEGSRAGRAVAIENCNLLVLTSRDLLHLVRAHPSIAMQVAAAQAMASANAANRSGEADQA